MVLGALTTIPAFLLGGQLAGRAGTLISALMVALGSAHIAVNSHIAWSNCLTPLFTTLGFWLLLRARSRSSGGALSLAGFSFGLAMQTHPAVVAFIPVLSAWTLAWGFFTRRWGWLLVAGAAACLGYSNMLVYNLATNFDSLRTAQRMSSEYAMADDADAGLAVFGSMGVLLARLVGGAIDQRSDIAAYLLDPAVVAGGTLSVVGLWLLARRGMWLPLAAVVAYLLLLPLVNTKFRTLVTIRYLMPVYPLLAAAIASAAVLLAQRIAPRKPVARGAVLTLMVIALIAPQLLSLQRYYDRLLRSGDTNERIMRLSHVIQTQRRPGELIVIDDGIGTDLPGTGVTEVRGFRYLLTMADVPFKVYRITSRRLEDELAQVPTLLIVVNARDAEQIERRWTLRSVEGRERAVIGRGSDYQVYRLER
jgi:4-amino-4-deoxy-L-arabinose transferase-like glycosyltransferase